MQLIVFSCVSRDILYSPVKYSKTSASSLASIAPDKAAYCVFAQFHGPENAIKFISVRTKTQ